MAMFSVSAAGLWANGSPMALRATCLLVACFTAFCKTGRADTYTQTVTIQFEDAESARRAVVAIAPLYDGHHRAVSCRWDDNWTSDNAKTRDVMEEFGIRGTWYLNDRRFDPNGGNEDYLSVAKSLLPGGNSIGSHSLTHPFLTYYHANRMFEETAGCRVVWEAGLDRPVTSYAFSFVDVRPEPEDRQVTLRMLETLRRAGYHHIAEYVDFFRDIDLPLELSPILPPENQPFESFRQAAEWAYNDPGLTDQFPMLSNSMHAWYETPFLNESYDALRRRFELLRGLEDVWHCNQNEYAAYRRQFRSAKIVESTAHGSEVTVRLERPPLRVLNDPTPLTLSVSGVDPANVASVSCASAEAVLSDRPLADRRLFHLQHDGDQGLPETIGWVANPDNGASGLKTDPEGDFPWLRGLLSAEGDGLRLVIEHEAENPLTDVHVTWRAPLHWRAVPATDRAAEIEPSKRAAFTASLKPTDSVRARIGDPYFVAEVDFRCGGVPGRVFFTCKRSGEAPDSSWPRDGFALLGPLGAESFDRERFLGLVESGECPDEWPTTGGPVSWRPQARDGYVPHERLNPEYVRTMGTWDAHSGTYALRSKVVSPVERTARLVTSHATECNVVVNGERFTGGTIALRQGENELVIVYPGATLKPATTRLAACYVSIQDPQTGQRFTDLRYEAY